MEIPAFPMGGAWPEYQGLSSGTTSCSGRTLDLDANVNHSKNYRNLASL